MTQRRNSKRTPGPVAQQAATDLPAATIRLVNCPQCGGDSVYALSNPYRPFCSYRCKNIDFGAWADESFRVPDPADPDAHSADDLTRLQ